MIENDLEVLVQRAVEAARPLCRKGTVANYIPALAEVNPDKLGLAVALVDGSSDAAGDADEAFSIQSISKVFTLAMALEQVGGQKWRWWLYFGGCAGQGRACGLVAGVK